MLDGKTDERPIDDILRKAAKEELSPEEIREQRLSFTMGMLGDKNTMTRAEVKDLIDRHYG